MAGNLDDRLIEPRESKLADKLPAKKDGTLHSLVQVQQVVQLGILIPGSTMIGWLFGVGLDRLLHQHWIYIAGLLFGATAGFVQMFRTVLASTKE